MNKNQSLDWSSWSFGTETLTIDGDGLAQGADQPCKKVLVKAEASKTAYIGNSASVDATYPILPSTDYIEITVNNTNLLHFFGTEDDVVYLIFME